MINKWKNIHTSNGWGLRLPHWTLIENDNQALWSTKYPTLEHEHLYTQVDNCYFLLDYCMFLKVQPVNLQCSTHLPSSLPGITLYSSLNDSVLIGVLMLSRRSAVAPRFVSVWLRHLVSVSPGLGGGIIIGSLVEYSFRKTRVVENTTKVPFFCVLEKLPSKGTRMFYSRQPLCV